MFYVGKLEESKFAVPHGHESKSRGFEHASLVDHTVGSVHMGASICRLQPQGSIDCAIVAAEKGIYVLQGELDVKRGDECFRLCADDYVLIPTGTPQALRNSAAKPVRWFEMQAPQPKSPGGWQDTYFLRDNDWPAQIARPEFGSAAIKCAGHFKQEKPLAAQAQGVASGLSVFRFMHREFGAQQFFMMQGELAVGGSRSYHDHTVEEFYFALSGESFMDIEGQRFHLRPGDVAWTGVGASHAFHHTGSVPFRWIETQAPQFPVQGGTRNYEDWEKYRTVK
jgi:mannose-6-phosphate isomerase-like protein (cupin superfamily)